MNVKNSLSYFGTIIKLNDDCIFHWGIITFRVERRKGMKYVWLSFYQVDYYRHLWIQPTLIILKIILVYSLHTCVQAMPSKAPYSGFSWNKCYITRSTVPRSWPEIPPSTVLLHLYWFSVAITVIILSRITHIFLFIATHSSPGYLAT